MEGKIYDVLLKGGRVIDPGQGMDRVCDVAVKDGLIAAVEQWISPDLASEVIDVEGQLVTPGLIDTHGHIFEHVTGCIDPNVASVVPSIFRWAQWGPVSMPTLCTAIAGRSPLLRNEDMVV